MTETKREEWRDLAAALQNETDPKRLAELREKLCKVLDKKRDGNGNATLISPN
jgi:RecB family exonuclease